MSNTDKYVTHAGQTVGYGINGDGNPEYMRINKQFGGLLIVDPHTQATIIGGRYFTHASTSLAVDAVKEYLIVTADSEVWPHMHFGMYASKICQFDIYEDTLWDQSTDTANLLTAFNAQRNSTDTSITVVSETPTTDSSEGTLLMTYKGGTTDCPTHLPLGEESDGYVVLKQDSVYLLRYTSGDADNLINLALNWYEVQYSS